MKSHSQASPRHGPIQAAPAAHSAPQLSFSRFRKETGSERGRGLSQAPTHRGRLLLRGLGRKPGHVVDDGREIGGTVEADVGQASRVCLGDAVHACLGDKSLGQPDCSPQCPRWKLPEGRAGRCKEPKCGVRQT